MLFHMRGKGGNYTEGMLQMKGAQLHLLPKALTLDKQAQHVSLETMKTSFQLAGILASLLIDQKLRAQFVCHSAAYFCLIRQPLLNAFLLSTTNLQTHTDTSVCVLCACVCTYVSSCSFCD